MNEFIAKVLNILSLDALTGRSWLDLISILAPSVILIIALFVASLFLKIRNWRFSAYAVCLILTLVYLPYELHRQATAMGRADANVNELHGNLQQLLNSAHLGHMNDIANKEVSAKILDELIQGLGKEQKKDLILTSWLISENEKNALNQMESKQKMLADEIKSTLNEARTQIIESRPPLEKISDTIVKRLDDDVNQLVEKKMQVFKQEIDSSLDNFKNGINSFVQGELKNYEEKLAVITQQNVDELRSYSGKAAQVFAEQVNKVNRESLQKMDATKASVDGIGVAVANIDLKNVTQQVKQLSASIEMAQKKSDLLFEYNECLRAAGMLDLGGKEEHCKTKLNEGLSSLK